MISNKWRIKLLKNLRVEQCPVSSHTPETSARDQYYSSPKTSPQPPKNITTTPKLEKKSKKQINWRCWESNPDWSGDCRACNSPSSWRPVEEKPQHHVLPLHHTTIVYAPIRHQPAWWNKIGWMLIWDSEETDYDWKTLCKYILHGLEVLVLGSGEVYPEI